MFQSGAFVARLGFLGLVVSVVSERRLVLLFWVAMVKSIEMHTLIRNISIVTTKKFKWMTFLKNSWWLQNRPY